MPKNGLFKTGPDDLLYHLVFFNTFEELKLPITGPMEDAGVVKLYEPSPTPCLYVAKAENMVGRILLMPCFLDGNGAATRLRQSLTSTARTRLHVSRRVVQTLLRRMAGAVATSTRSAHGCGNSDVASLA